MKGWIKAAGTVALAAAAAVSARAAVKGILDSAPSADAGGGEVFVYEASCSAGEAEYILMEHSGVIAVFMPAGGDEPVSLTDIPVDTLRSVDRELLREGIAVSDREELLTLLEDLGS